MQILRVAAVLCVLGVFALPARSQSNTSGNTGTGNDLIGDCHLAVSAQENPNSPITGMDGFEIGYCLGLSRGVADTLTESGLACVPTGVTTGQDVRVIEKFLKDHPAKLNQPATFLAMEAIVEAFRCKK